MTNPTPTYPTAFPGCINKQAGLPGLFSVNSIREQEKHFELYKVLGLFVRCGIHPNHEQFKNDILIFKLKDKRDTDKSGMRELLIDFFGRTDTKYSSLSDDIFVHIFQSKWATYFHNTFFPDNQLDNKSNKLYIPLYILEADVSNIIRFLNRALEHGRFFQTSNYNLCLVFQYLCWKCDWVNKIVYNTNTKTYNFSAPHILTETYND